MDCVALNKFKADTVGDVLDAMNKYQQQHDIKGECVANSSLLCAILTAFGFKCEIVATIGVYVKGLSTVAHFVVKATIPDLDGKMCEVVIDPSYEWNIVKDDVAWYDNLVDFPKHPVPEYRRQQIAKFIEYKKNAEKMNEEFRTGVFAIERRGYAENLLKHIRNKVPIVNDLF